MKNRTEYIDKLAAQLKEWSAKIDELEVKARAAKEGAKAGYESQVSELKKKRETATRKLQELKSSSSEAWDVTEAKEKFIKP
jgi:uncharacterized coiled-coil DUF342 family protein